MDLLMHLEGYPEGGYTFHLERGTHGITIGISHKELQELINFLTSALHKAISAEEECI